MRKIFLAGTALVLLTFVAFVLITARAGAGVNGATPPDAPDLLASGLPNQALGDGSISTALEKVAVSPTITTTCDPAWHLVSSPNFVSGSNFLYGVKEIAPDDVWAVGYYTSTDSISRTLTLHWNGTDWNIIPSPNTEAHDNILRSVSASASNDVWAVGYYGDDDNMNQTLTMHWDGSQWSIVPSPSTTSPANFLWEVASVGENDVWAVGYSGDGGYRYAQTLTMHWAGVQWRIVSSPNPERGDYLQGITALATGDVWAVGTRRDSQDLSQTLILHWGGSQWDIVPSPNGPGDSTLTAIDAHTANDIWAVGHYFAGPQESPPLVEHWDGSQWSIVPSPGFGGSRHELNAVVALASDDAWILGYRHLGSPFILHWDGGQWSITEDNHDQTLAWIVVLGADGLSSTDIWAVGTYFGADTGGLNRTRILRYDGTCAPGGTPTPTPTACPIQFSDVPSGSTFYPFVRCLACRGIVNGYPDGTFRPSNPSTRGQTAKIVSNAAGLIDDPGPQRFQDIPPGSTFYTYTQRLANIGVVSGYPCGGAGEPCVPPDSLPYFRPNAGMSRGQVAKLASEAAQLDNPVGPQRFQDLPQGSTFYTYTQRLANMGIVSGYPCGGAGEPCVPPDNLPYFRSGNENTRGQVSKIVSYTFFLDCYSP